MNQIVSERILLFRSPNGNEFVSSIKIGIPEKVDELEWKCGVEIYKENRTQISCMNCNIIVDIVSKAVTIYDMILSFKHKGLALLFERGRTRRIRHDLQSRCLRRLDVLDQAETLSDLNVPGFNFHGLHGVPKRHSIHVNGPWCITFEWKEGDALRVDLEQYH